MNLATKFILPRTAADAEARPMLSAQFATGAARKLTLVCAPAGFGKTTAVAAWLQHQADQETPRRCAWYTVDKRDDSLASFLGCVVEAFRTALPDALGATADRIKTPLLASADMLMATLLADLARLPGCWTLVVDDYHLLTSPAVHQLMGALLRYLPENLTVILATRQDPPIPLARLRAAQAIQEIRATDLALTAAETEALVARILGRSLTPEAASELYAQTGGWVAGVRLAAATLEAAADETAILADLRQHLHGYLFAYLVEEVLAMLPPSAYTFLLHTSILPDLHPDLCDAVLGEETGSAGQIAELARHNLLVNSVDIPTGWQRCHPQFRRLLRTQLRGEVPDATIREYHRRAATWHAARGQVQAGMRAYLAAGEPTAAADLLELHLNSFYHREQYTLLEQLLAQLPEEETAYRPALLLAKCWIADFRGQWAIIRSLAARIRRLLEQETASQDPAQMRALRGELAALLSSPVLNQSDLTSQAAYAREALALLPADDELSRGYALTSLALALSGTGHAAEATQLLEGIVQGSSVAPSAQALRVIDGLIMQYLLGGYLDKAEQVARIQLAVAVKGKYGQSEGSAHAFLGMIACLRACPEQAVEHIAFVYNNSTVVYHNSQLILYYFAVWLANPRDLQVYSGDILAQMRGLGLALAGPETQRTVDALEAAVALSRHDHAAAIAWARATPMPASVIDLVPLRRLVWAYALFAEGSPDALDQARAAVEELVFGAGGRGNSELFGMEARVLLAVIYETLGDGVRAQEILVPAVIFGAARGTLLHFVGHGLKMDALLTRLANHRTAGVSARRLLDQLAQAHTWVGFSRTPTAAQPVVEPLTEREIEVLKLLAKNLSNKRIADQLVVSPNTVRNHLRALFKKLNVSTRAEAVLRGRSLGQFPPH